MNIYIYHHTSHDFLSLSYKVHSTYYMLPSRHTKLVGWLTHWKREKQNQPNQNTRKKQNVVCLSYIKLMFCKPGPPPHPLFKVSMTFQIRSRDILKVTPFSSSLVHLIPNFCAYKSPPNWNYKLKNVRMSFPNL